MCACREQELGSSVLEYGYGFGVPGLGLKAYDLRCGSRLFLGELLRILALATSAALVLGLAALLLVLIYNRK